MTYYVSVTGLEVKSIWQMPRFFLYVNKINAAQAEGNVEAHLCYRKGVHHTLTIWKDRKSMTRFMASGAHAQAMKVVKELSSPTGTKVYGYFSETIPTWEVALELWEEHGALHGKKPVRSVMKQETTLSSLPWMFSLLFVACLVFACLQRFQPDSILSAN